MADKKISELDAITGAATAADDVFVVVDTSGSVTRKITRDELKSALSLSASASFDQISMGDNDKILFGDSNDLEIYHDGSHSYIDESGGTGNLRIRATNLVLQSVGEEDYATFIANGAATLFYDNAEKIATKATGIDVTGDVTVSGGVYVGGTGAANYLSDYEEGSYTVQLFDASSGGNASSTSVTGNYTKIGNQVTVRFDSLNNISTAGMTGANDLYFSLPFSASSTGRSAGSVVFDTLTFASGTTMVTPQVLDSASRGQFRTTGTAITDKVTEVQDIASGATDIHTFTLTYFAD
tara:strand:- start:504 stop:1391 length:888 start_codon:yes stop_codon:yes gene_type:complete